MSFYVIAVDDDVTCFVSGPFSFREQAEGQVAAVRATCSTINPEAASFYWGTERTPHDAGPGLLDMFEAKLRHLAADLSPREANEWVRREVARCQTLEAKRQRLTVELAMDRLFPTYAMNLPTQRAWARGAPISKLRRDVHRDSADLTTCANKTRFANRPDANRAADIKATHDLKLRPYFCEHCRGWHLTSHAPR